MNDRIRDIAEHCDFYVGNEHYNESHEEKQRLWVEKFAELIVRECANKLRETDYELVFAEDGMCDPSISDAMLVAASDIEEHFGVES